MSYDLFQFIDQATMPSSEKHPSAKPMWRGTQVAYGLISACLYPIAIGGYWAYGQLVLFCFAKFKIVETTIRFLMTFGKFFDFS